MWNVSEVQQKFMLSNIVQLDKVNCVRLVMVWHSIKLYHHETVYKLDHLL